MAAGSLLQIYPYSFKPSAPPAGSFIMYAKTDDNLYLQDSSGIEYPFASTAAITQLTGEGSATGPGVVPLTLSNSAVIGKVLTGFISGPNSVVLATDSILQAVQKLQAQVTATTGSSITALTGDVSATGPGSVPAIVNSVGGSSAANIHSAELAANAATASNTASTIVKRDASGNFSANIITASLNGNANTSTNFTGSLSGDVTGTQSATVVATVGGSSAANIHSAELAANAATDVNTPSTIVKRDASGNFSATTITANITGNVSGSSSTFTGSLSGDVTGTQSATAISNTTVTGKLLTGFVSGPGTVSATDSILTAIDKLDGNINSTTGSAITALTGDVVATGPGSVAAIIQSNVVSNAKLAQMSANTLKGNNTISTANAADLTIPQVVTMFGGIPVTQIPDQANAAGTSNTFARADHIHNIPSGVPVQIGTSNVQGSATTFSLADHVHNHGNQTVGTLHAAVTTSVNGFMSATDKTKLDTITTPGTNTQILISNGTTLTPQTVSGDITITNTGVVAVNSVTGTIPVNKGGTGQTSYTDGQLLIGSTSGNTLVKSTLTAGTGISIVNAGGSITVASSGSTATTTKTANYTILTSDSTIFVNSTGGAFTLTLPNPSTIAGKIYRIIGTSGTMNANPVTLAPNGAEKIEGLAASKVLQTNWGWFQVTTDGTDWYVG